MYALETQLDPHTITPTEAKFTEFPRASLLHRADLAVVPGLLISTLSALSGHKLAVTYSNLEEIPQASCETDICKCLSKMGGLVLRNLTTPHWFALRKILSLASNIYCGNKSKHVIPSQLRSLTSYRCRPSLLRRQNMKFVQDASYIDVGGLCGCSVVTRYESCECHKS